MLLLRLCLLAAFLPVADGFALAPMRDSAILRQPSSSSSALGHGMQMMACAPANTKKTKPTRNVNVAERSGKVEGLTNLAPLKVYVTGAALLWAIIGSIAQ